MQKGFDNLFKIIIATAVGVGIVAVVSKVFGAIVLVAIIALLVAVIVWQLRRYNALKKEIAKSKNS